MVKDIKLTPEQQNIYDIVVKKKRNIFFTGCGGTGKSAITTRIVRDLRFLHSPASVAITASTGRAAFNVHGITLHSFAGIGLGVESIERLANKVKFNSRASERWKDTKVLIIDEVSMISGELFDKLEYIARYVLNNDKPFGGIQLVLVGDLLQLPPVSTDKRVPRVFQAESWDKCIQNYERLGTVFRQSDMEFIKALTCIRVGAANEIVSKFIEKVSRSIEYPPELQPVILYSTKSRADNFNEAKLAEIDSEIRTYTAKDRYDSKYGSGGSLLNSCPASKELQLKKGAQVMLVKNLTKTLVNGTTGIIVGFTKPLSVDKHKQLKTVEPIPIVRFTLADDKMFTRPISEETWETVLPNGNVQCSRTQIPLILSWAMTIHKSQGQTIQRLKVDLQGIFESGQIYTALSRAVTMETLEVVNFNPDTIKVDTDSLEFCIKHDLI